MQDCHGSWSEKNTSFQLADTLRAIKRGKALRKEGGNVVSQQLQPTYSALDAASLFARHHCMAHMKATFDR